jgi:hypothetical protein
MNAVFDKDQCCPPFQPEGWDDQRFEWTDRRFIRERVNCLFYMPLGFGKVISGLFGKVVAAEALTPDNLCLSDHISPWKMDIYLAVDKVIPAADQQLISGKFYSRVYEGPFGQTGKWMKDFRQKVMEKGLTLKKTYFWYTTCPKCARKYGKNYVVIIGELSA